MKKLQHNYVLVYSWHIEDDTPTNLDILRTPFAWNEETIRNYVRKYYGASARFEIITNNITIAKES